MADFKKYAEPIECLRVEQVRGVLQRTQEVGVLEKALDRLSELEIDRVFIDSRLANIIKEEIAFLKSGIPIDDDIIKCGGRSGGSAGNVRGFLPSRKTSDLPSFGGIEKLEAALLVESSLDGGLRLTEQASLTAIGGHNFFDVFFPFYSGRCSLEGRHVMDMCGFAIDEKATISEIFQPHSIQSFGDFCRWLYDPIIRHRNASFDIQLAKSMLRGENGHNDNVSGVAGRLLGSELRDDGPYRVTSTPITVRRIAHDIRYPLNFLGANLDDVSCWVSLVVLAKKPAILVGPDGAEVSPIKRGVVTRSGIDWWRSSFEVLVERRHAALSLLVDFDSIECYD
jgi:hypothetical protein